MKVDNAPTEEHSFLSASGDKFSARSRLVIRTIGITGASLIIWSFFTSFHATWIEDHIRIIRGQLQGLACTVRDFKATHGRYPTNDEGLGVLDDLGACAVFTNFFPSGDAARMYRMSLRIHYGRQARETLNLPTGLASRDEQLRIAKEMAEEGAQITLDADPSAYYADDPLEVGPVAMVPLAVAINRNGLVYWLDDGQVLSPWLQPYMYENRTMGPESRFKGSPVEGDWTRRFSVKVDKGVFIYSPSAEFMVRRQGGTWWHCRGPLVMGAAMVLVALLMGITLSLRHRQSAPFITALKSVFLTLGGGVALAAVIMPSCYAMARPFSYQDPAMVRRQVELLDQYRERGVISAETHARCMAAIERGTDPARKPRAEEP